jgi:tRNA (mo5U34)-methyltransferase
VTSSQSHDFDREAALAAISEVPTWYHQIEVLPGIVTPGVNDSSAVLARLPLPPDCTGLRALDIGARDGFFSFELERRGADVVAVDYIGPDQTGFSVASKLLGSRVPYVVENVYNLSPERFGEFDLILFLGVIYHLRDPLLALERIWSVCKGRLVVESQVLDHSFLTRSGELKPLEVVAPGLADACIAQFYPAATLNGDHTNWWVPTLACLKAMIGEAAFDVDYEVMMGARAIVGATRSDDSERIYYRDIDKTLPAAG